MDVKASLLKVPPMLSGYENLEFSLYANAIGAMYHRPKEDETSNLLTTDASMGQSADGGTKSAKAQQRGEVQKRAQGQECRHSEGGHTSTATTCTALYRYHPAAALTRQGRRSFHD